MVSTVAEENNMNVSRDYHILRRMIDDEQNFIEVKALGEDLAMEVIRYNYCIIKFTTTRSTKYYFFQNVDENSLQRFKQLPMAPSVQCYWTMFSANFR